MELQRAKASQSADSAAGDGLDLGATQAGETFDDVAVERDVSKPDDTYQEQSAPRIIFLLISVFTSMFLVALDRTIISTVCLHSIKLATRCLLLSPCEILC